MKSQANKASEGAKEQAASMAEMTETLRKNCEQALRTGLKFQEEAGRWWSAVLNPATCFEHWQDQLNSATHTANSLLPLAQKPIAEMIDLAERNSRVTADLMKKVLDACQAPSPAESKGKWADFCTSSVEAVRANTEAVSQINSKIMDSWAAFIREGN